MIKLYPGGRFSGLLADGSIKPGDELTVTGPYGVFTLRRARRGGCCSSAAAPAWRRSCRCCGRWRRTGSDREATYYYGARTEADLFHLDELGGLPCAVRPALSEDATAGTARPA